ncbi:MAG: DUF2442 domain-containing protein [Caldilineaceae bacterium]
MNTLSNLYLGSKPVTITAEDDQLRISLEDGRDIFLPLQLVSQIDSETPMPPESQILLLRQPPQIDHIHITDTALHVYLTDDRTLSCPLAWFPRLLHGTQMERNHYELSGDNDVIHWPDLDEDIELMRLFEGGKSLESEQSIQRWLLARHEARARNTKVLSVS